MESQVMTENLKKMIMGLITVSDIMDGLDSVQLDSEKLSVVLL